jgi:hypothetical protein
MANSGGLITAPVSIQDVRQVLGNSSTDLGTLCKASQTNMWAKYKPVVLALIDTVSQFDKTNNKWYSWATWWKGTTGTCGCVPYVLRSIADVVDHCSGGLNGWSYTKPGGGAASPYRLTDFAGYYHGAVAPIGSFLMETYNTQDAAMVCSLTQSSERQLTLADLNNFNNYYLAFYAVRTGGGTKVLTAQKTLGNNGNAVDFSLGSWNAGTWTIYPFITDESGDDGTISAIRHSCPIASSMTYTVVDHVITIWTTNVAVSGIRTVTAVIHVKNNTSSSVTLNNNYFKIRFRNKTYDDPLVAGETSGSISTVTVASNTETTINFSANAELSTLQEGANLWIQMAGSSVTSRDYMPIPYSNSNTNV